MNSKGNQNNLPRVIMSHLQGQEACPGAGCNLSQTQERGVLSWCFLSGLVLARMLTTPAQHYLLPHLFPHFYPEPFEVLSFYKGARIQLL